MGSKQASVGFVACTKLNPDQVRRQGHAPRARAAPPRRAWMRAMGKGSALAIH